MRVRQLLDEPAPKHSIAPLMVGILLVVGAGGIAAGVLFVIATFDLGDGGLPTSASVLPETPMNPAPVVEVEPSPAPTLTPTLVPTLTPTPVPTPTPTEVPTPIPFPDSDGDGLTDPVERRLGTNPLRSDSDADGLTDAEETRLGSSPLVQDTDRDGVIDGDDLFPLLDIGVSVTIMNFNDVSLGTADGSGDGDPYFRMIVEGVERRSQVHNNAVRLTNVGPFVFNVSDDLQFVEITVVAVDDDFFADDRYDISGIPEEKALKLSFDLLAGRTTISGDGRIDGHGSLEGTIRIRVESERWVPTR